MKDKPEIQTYRKGFDTKEEAEAEMTRIIELLKSKGIKVNE